MIAANTTTATIALFFNTTTSTTSSCFNAIQVLSIERQLNQPPVNLEVLQKLFEQPREDATSVVTSHLADFAALVADPARRWVTAKLFS